MKFIIVLVVLVNCLFANVNKYQVVAKVDNINITSDDVNNFVNSQLQRSFLHSKIPENEREKLENEAVEELIKTQLIYQYAKRTNLKRDEKEFIKIKKTITKRFKNKADLIKALKKQNFTMQDLDRVIETSVYKKQVILNQVKTDFTDKELKEYYDNNNDKFVMPSSYKISLITINIDPSKKDSIKVAKDKITLIHDKLLKGGNFKDLAKKYSNDNSRIFGGDLGFIHEGQMSQIDKTIKELKNGELSAVSKSDVFFFIVKLEAKKEPFLVPFNKIIKKLKTELIESYQKKKLEKILLEQRSISKVEIIK